MTITNTMGLPDALVKAVSTDKHNAPGCISATTLLQGAKQIILTDRHWDELTDDVSNRIWAVFGTAVHKVLEVSNKNDFTEECFKWKCGSKTVTGQVDLYDMKNEIICDYKSANVWKVIYHDFSDWQMQGLIYAFLLKQSGLNVKKCRFIALLKDWSMTKAKTESNYPRSPTYIYEFTVTSELLDGIKKYIEEKIADIEHCEKFADDDIPECNEHERWAKPTTYAVMKAGRKTAVKAGISTREEAETIAAGTPGCYVQERAGKSGRCEGYCLCSEFCSFYKRCKKQTAAAA